MLIVVDVVVVVVVVFLKLLLMLFLLSLLLLLLFCFLLLPLPLSLLLTRDNASWGDELDKVGDEEKGVKGAGDARLEFDAEREDVSTGRHHQKRDGNRHATRQ